MLKCLSKQKTIDSLRTEIWDPQIQPQELKGLDLVSVILWKIVLQLLLAKSFYEPRLRQGFIRLLRKMKKFSVANVPPRFDLSQLPNAGEEGDSHVFCHGKNSKIILENSRFSRRKTGRYITEKQNRNKTTNAS